MRIILQDRESLLYFKGNNEWTPDIDKAADFQQLVQAIEFVRTSKLPNLDAVMWFGDPKYDVRVLASPLNDSVAFRFCPGTFVFPLPKIKMAKGLRAFTMAWHARPISGFMAGFVCCWRILRPPGKLQCPGRLPLRPPISNSAEECASRRPGACFVRRPIASRAARKVIPRRRFKIKIAGRLPVQSVTVNPKDPFTAFLAQIAGGQCFPRLAILCGNPRAVGRRFIILLFDPANRPAAVVKAGVGEPAARLIDHEASFLNSVRHDLPGVPRLRSTFQSARIHALALDFFPGLSPGSGGDAGLESLLSSWIDASRTVRLVELPPWKKLAASMGPDVPAWMSSPQLQNLVCHPVLFHGDFAPWNVKISGNAWHVLDWEQGEDAGVPGWDWFHYVIRGAVLVCREPAASLAARVERLLVSQQFARYAAQAEIMGIERLLVLAYLNYSIRILRQTEELARVESLLQWLLMEWGYGKAA